MKNTLATAKKFVKKHKTTILVTSAVVATAIVVRKLDNGVIDSLTDFIDDKGLTDEYINQLVEEI